MTVMGCEDHYKRTWVHKTLQVRNSKLSSFCTTAIYQHFLPQSNFSFSNISIGKSQLDAKDKGPAVAVINSTISAATSLSSISLVLSSLIGAWIGSSSGKNILSNSVLYGDTSPSISSIKYIAILSCFLVAFASFVQTIRNYALAAFLISIPNSEIPVSYVQKPIIRGSNYWAVGLRALYIAASLILWIFGPISMFVSSVIVVVILHNLDTNSTPPYQFQPQLRHNLFQKIGEELATVTRAFAHQERLNEN